MEKGKNKIKPIPEKGLQNLTDLGGLEALDVLSDYLEEDKGNAKEVVSNLQDLLNKSYSEKLGIEDKVVDLAVRCYDIANESDRGEWLKNVTYESNHNLIGTFIHNYICNHKKFPTVTDIKEETGLSRQTVYSHIKNGFSDDLNSLIKGKLSYMIPKALEKLYLIGINTDNATALKNFIELSGYTKETPANINNYIQINSLKLSKAEFEELPTDILLQVEKILLGYTGKEQKITSITRHIVRAKD